MGLQGVFTRRVSTPNWTCSYNLDFWNQWVVDFYWERRGSPSVGSFDKGVVGGSLRHTRHSPEHNRWVPTPDRRRGSPIHPGGRVPTDHWSPVLKIVGTRGPCALLPCTVLPFFFPGLSSLGCGRGSEWALAPSRTLDPEWRTFTDTFKCVSFQTDLILKYNILKRRGLGL